MCTPIFTALRKFSQGTAEFLQNLISNRQIWVAMEATRKETKVPPPVPVQAASEPPQPEKPKETQVQRNKKAASLEYKNPPFPQTKQHLAKASVLNLTANFGRSFSHSAISPRNRLHGSVSAPDVSLLLK